VLAPPLRQERLRPVDVAHEVGVRLVILGILRGGQEVAGHERGRAGLEARLEIPVFRLQLVEQPREIVGGLDLDEGHHRRLEHVAHVADHVAELLVQRAVVGVDVALQPAQVIVEILQPAHAPRLPPPRN